MSNFPLPLMANELDKLEAAILNLQEPYESISKKYERAKQDYFGNLKRGLAEIPGLKEAMLLKGSLLEQIASSTGILSTAGDEETQKKVGVLLRELDEKHGNQVRELSAKKLQLEKELAEYNAKLCEFTVLTPVLEAPNPDHVHIYVVHSEKAYKGQIDFGKAFLGLERQEYRMCELEEIKSKNKCPMYIATHPSRVASPPVIFCGAVRQLLEKFGQENASVMKKKIDQAMYGSMN